VSFVANVVKAEDHGTLIRDVPRLECGVSNWPVREQAMVTKNPIQFILDCVISMSFRFLPSLFFQTVFGEGEGDASWLALGGIGVVKVSTVASMATGGFHYGFLENRSILLSKQVVVSRVLMWWLSRSGVSLPNSCHELQSSAARRSTWPGMWSLLCSVGLVFKGGSKFDA
jgi:hypothetical protein